MTRVQWRGSTFVGDGLGQDLDGRLYVCRVVRYDLISWRRGLTRDLEAAFQIHVALEEQRQHTGERIAKVGKEREDLSEGVHLVGCGGGGRGQSASEEADTPFENLWCAVRLTSAIWVWLKIRGSPRTGSVAKKCDGTGKTTGNLQATFVQVARQK
jgi:hypothetical protein